MRKKILFSTVLNGLVSISPQIIGLFLLKNADFGLFSAVYLIFALAISVSLSILCDPWAILSKRQTSERSIYTSNLTILSLFFGFLAGVVGLVLDAGLWFVALAFLGVALGTYRSGARYFLVQSSRWDKVLVADIISLVAIVAVVSINFILDIESLYIVMLAWLFSSGLACLFGPYFCGFKINGLRWVKQNWRTIKPLIADSSAMDLSSIGTPYLLLPVLGLNGFGVYRAISNLSAPVRLLISPLRPIIISSPNRVMGKMAGVIIVLASLAISSVAMVILIALNRSDISLGVLADVSVFAVPAGFYLFGSALLSIYPLIARSLQNARLLLIGRSSQTVFGVLFPISGYYAYGLNGAMWAFGIFSLISGSLWMVLSILAWQNK